MTPWPFAPLIGLIEELEWLTDIIPSKAGEQRIALRTAPRRTFNFDHILTDQQATSARTLILGAQADGNFYVPDWPQVTTLGAVSPGTDVPAATTNVIMGSKALLWQSDLLNEVVDIAAGVIATVTLAYTNAKLLPLWLAHAPNGLDVDRAGAQINRASIAFAAYENADVGATTYSQYRTHDVVPDSPRIGGLSESITWQASGFDNNRSTPEYIRSRTTSDMTFSMNWRETTAAGRYALTQWLHSRRGRQKAFWLSSRGHDFDLAAPINGTTITVFRRPGLTALSVFDIDITDTAGASIYRRVTAVAVGAVISGRETVDFTIDSTATVASVKRLSMMRLCRFDADRIELDHRAAEGTTVSVPCIEIPA